jgi:hypothetical protein
VRRVALPRIAEPPTSETLRKRVLLTLALLEAEQEKKAPEPTLNGRSNGNGAKP